MKLKQWETHVQNLRTVYASVMVPNNGGHSYGSEMPVATKNRVQIRYNISIITRAGPNPVLMAIIMRVIHCSIVAPRYKNSAPSAIGLAFEALADIMCTASRKIYCQHSMTNCRIINSRRSRPPWEPFETAVRTCFACQGVLTPRRFTSSKQVLQSFLEVESRFEYTSAASNTWSSIGEKARKLAHCSRVNMASPAKRPLT